MQRLERKAEFLVAPDRRAGHAADRRVLIEGKVGEEAGQRRFGLLERLRAPDRSPSSRQCRRRRERAGPAARRRQERRRTGERSRRPPRRGQLQEFATLPVRHCFLRSFAAESEPRAGGQRRRRSRAKMKNQPARRRKTRRNPGAFHPWPFELYILFCGAARRILRDRENCALLVMGYRWELIAHGDRVVEEPPRPDAP